MAYATDEELYSELLNSSGDNNDAFHAIYKRYSGPLFRFIYRFTDDPHLMIFGFSSSVFLTYKNRHPNLQVISFGDRFPMQILDSQFLF